MYDRKRFSYRLLTYTLFSGEAPLARGPRVVGPSDDVAGLQRRTSATADREKHDVVFLNFYISEKTRSCGAVFDFLSRGPAYVFFESLHNPRA